MLAYTRLYDFTVEAVSSVSPSYQVAGPVTAGSYLEPLLMHLHGVSISGNSSADPEGRNWATGEIGGGKIEYLSYHNYASWPEAFLDKFEQVESAVAAVDQAFGSEYEGTPSIISEYSPYTLSRHAYVTRFPAAWLAGIVDAILERADAKGNPNLIPHHMNYLTTPVARAFGDGGLETDGLATTVRDSREVVKLPVFNAFEALGYMGGRRLHDSTAGEGAGAIASLENLEGGQQAITLLIYRLDPDDPDCMDDSAEPVELLVRGLPFSEFSLEHYRIDHEHSNAYRLWAKGNRNLTALQQKDDLAQLNGHPSHISVEGDSYRLAFSLPSNSLSLIRLVGDPSDPFADEDINQDGYVDSLDVQLVARLALGLLDDPVLADRADLDQDGVVEAEDVAQVVAAILTASDP
jgi:xylan 1,4-beta-xylosidase